MKNLQINNPTIGAQSFKLVDRAGKDTYIYGIELSFDRILVRGRGVWGRIYHPNNPNRSDSHIYLFRDYEGLSTNFDFNFGDDEYRCSKYWKMSPINRSTKVFIPNTPGGTSYETLCWLEVDNDGTISVSRPSDSNLYFINSNADDGDVNFKITSNYSISAEIFGSGTLLITIKSTN